MSQLVDVEWMEKVLVSQVVLRGLHDPSRRIVMFELIGGDLRLSSDESAYDGEVVRLTYFAESHDIHSGIHQSQQQYSGLVPPDVYRKLLQQAIHDWKKRNFVSWMSRQQTVLERLFGQSPDHFMIFHLGRFEQFLEDFQTTTQNSSLAGVLSQTTGRFRSFLSMYLWRLSNGLPSE